ncbi:MAG: hypothetical protein AAGH19_09080 [Pseudomonadota bacterium]
MALDDLMRCLRKGVLLGFVTVTLAVVAVGLTIEPDAFADTDRSVSAGEAGNKPSEENARAMFDEYSAWSTPIWCALLTHELPIVRVHASLVVEANQASSAAFGCEGPAIEWNPVAVRSKALRDGWNDPVVLSPIYFVDCHNPRRPTDCDRAKVHAQLMAVDPGNAMFQMIPVDDDAHPDQEVRPFTDAEKARLARAAEGTHYREYVYAGIFDTYQALEHAQEQLGAFTPSDDWFALMDAAQVAGDDVGQSMSTVTLFAALVAMAVPASGNLLSGCRASQANGDQNTVDDCLRVADLMTDTSRTDLTAGLGRGIKRTLENPEYVGADREEQDPNAWKRWMRGLVSSCQMPRGLPGDFLRLPAPMPMSHLSQYVEDLQKQDEWTARRNATAREYATHPEAFAFDPARCDELYALDESVQRALAAEHKAASSTWRTVEDDEQVLQSAGKALEASTRQPSSE